MVIRLKLSVLTGLLLISMHISAIFIADTIFTEFYLPPFAVFSFLKVQQIIETYNCQKEYQKELEWREQVLKPIESELHHVCSNKRILSYQDLYECEKIKKSFEPYVLSVSKRHAQKYETIRDTVKQSYDYKTIAHRNVYLTPVEQQRNLVNLMRHYCERHKIPMSTPALTSLAMLDFKSNEFAQKNPTIDQQRYLNNAYEKQKSDIELLEKGIWR